MNHFNVDEVFQALLEKIENNEVRTTHDLRLQLESLEEQFRIKQLLLLVGFREWLTEKNINLVTENGIVTLEKI